MATVKTANYTASQVAIIAAFSGTGPDGKLTLADATTIAAMPEMNGEDGARKPRSIVAKIKNMGLPYANKQPTRKDGSAVATKAALVAQIAEASGVTFTALDKAAREDLVALRDWAVSVAA